MYPVSMRPAAQNPPAPPEVGLNISEMDILNGFSINRGGLRKLSIACQIIHRNKYVKVFGASTVLERRHFVCAKLNYLPESVMVHYTNQTIAAVCPRHLFCFVLYEK